MREYRESSRKDGDRAEQEVYDFMIKAGADIRRNPEGDVDFTVWNNGTPLYHIEVEHKLKTSEPMAVAEGLQFLQHKVDKYARFERKVFYVIVITHWHHFYVMSMQDIQRDGELVKPITTRKNMGLVYRVSTFNNNMHQRSLK